MSCRVSETFGSGSLLVEETDTNVLCKELVFLNYVSGQVLERAYLFRFRLGNCLGLAQKITFMFVEASLVEGPRD